MYQSVVGRRRKMHRDMPLWQSKRDYNSHSGRMEMRKEEWEVLGEEMRKLDECDMEKSTVVH